MPNWVYNELTVFGPESQLKSYAEKIGDKGNPFNLNEIAKIIACSWDSRDVGRESSLSKNKNSYVFNFNTAWTSRPQLICDLSTAFPELNFELYYIEEGPQFAGAIIYKGGKLKGETYLGDEELFDFYGEVEDDGIADDDYVGDSDEELDTDRLKSALVEKARLGFIVNYDERTLKLKNLRANASSAHISSIEDEIKEILSDAKNNRPKSKKTNEKLCAVIRKYEANYSYRVNADIKMMPIEFLSEDVAVQFYMTNEENLKAIPPTLKNQKFYDLYIRSEQNLSPYYNPKLKDVPKKFRTLELLKFACKNSVDSLEHMHNDEKTIELCKLAVIRYGQQLKHVPTLMRTEEICKLAIKKNGAALAFVPKAFRTAKLCRDAVKDSAMAIKFVPKSEITLEMFNDFIESPRGKAYENSLEPDWIPKKYRTKELFEKLLPSQPKIVSIIPPAVLEELMGIEKFPLKLVEGSGFYFNWLSAIPEKYCSQELYEYIVENYPNNHFESLPEFYKTPIVCINAFNQNGSKALKFVPNKVFTSKFIKQILDTQSYDTETWKLNGGFKLLQEFLEGFPELYIPDAAWNKELVKAALKRTKFAALFFPKEYVTWQMFKNVIDDDVALYFCFDISVRKLFVEEFSKAFKDLEFSALNRFSFFSILLSALHKMISEALPASFLDKEMDGFNQKRLERHGFNQKIIKLKVCGVVVQEVPSSRKLILLWEGLAKGLMHSRDSDNPSFKLGEMMLK